MTSSINNTRSELFILKNENTKLKLKYELKSNKNIKQCLK
ncbi:unnamed protein product, partial [Rotaria sordida]